MNGGHEVPISKVISRYFKSLEQIKQAFTFVEPTEKVHNVKWINN